VGLPDPQPGLVISYAFLWKQEYDTGHEDGLKDRPCAVVLVSQDKNGDRLVTVVPITHTKPIDMAAAVELPAKTRARLGLDENPSWVVLTDLNRFIWPGPDLRPIEPAKWDYGFLPPKLFEEIKTKMLAVAGAGRADVVSRTV
jgi:uncharacterized protein YifN (PemK superfamily)